MRKEVRLRGRKLFSRIFTQGRSWSNRLLILRALPNGLELDRYGFVASKKLGKAVKRNLVRRRLREYVRQRRLKSGWDLIFIARAGAASVAYKQLGAAMEELLHRARLLNEEP